MVRNTRKYRLPRDANTMNGISAWYKSVFERLGWMVLAKAKGYNDKVAVYKKSIVRLVSSIEHVMGEYENMNRVHDLKVLHMNILCLWDFVQKHLQ